MKSTQKNLGLGITAGISTGFFWGIPFLVPQLLPNYSPLEIAFGRFAFFGLMSLLFVNKVIRLIASLSKRDCLRLFLLSASGFWFYSMLLFWGVQKTDGVIASLIIGLLPLTIPLCTPGRKSGGFQFYLGLLALLAGLINLFAYPLIAGIKSVKIPEWSGILALTASLSLWTWFAISNSTFLRTHSEINRKDFASVIGAISLISILPIFLVRVDLAEFVQRGGFSHYLIYSAVLGIGSSWLANWLWNICSFHCPSEISGPLIVSETIFGLLYSFVYEQRIPHLYEAVSIVLFLAGVTLAVTDQLREHRKAE